MKKKQDRSYTLERGLQRKNCEEERGKGTRKSKD
jgi:hypothetical protein